MKKIFIFAALFFAVTSSLRTAEAVKQGDYNRPASVGGVSISDWNNLENDFLLIDGTRLPEANLDFSNSWRIKNAGAGNNDADMANFGKARDMVATALAGTAQGGDTYINWGRGDCQAGDDVLYSGFGFGNLFSASSGGENEICVSSIFDPPLSPHIGARSDTLYPLMTGETVYFPSIGTAYQERTLIKCAVCYRQKSSCFLSVGTQQCSVDGFPNKAYQGYMTAEINGAGAYRSTSNASCLNQDFDSSGGSAALSGSIWRGAVIGNNFTLDAYLENKFIKCAVCCK